MPKDPKPDTPDPGVDLVTLEFLGEKVTIPRLQDDWTLDASMALYQALGTNQSSAWVDFMQLLLGPEQWNRIVTAIEKQPKQTGAFKEFFLMFRTAINTECVA